MRDPASKNIVRNNWGKQKDAQLWSLTSFCMSTGKYMCIHMHTLQNTHIYTYMTKTYLLTAAVSVVLGLLAIMNTLQWLKGIGISLYQKIENDYIRRWHDIQCKISGNSAGEMAQQVRKLEALAKDLKLAPITQIMQLTANPSFTSINSSSRESDTFFWTQRAPALLWNDIYK